MPLLHSVSDDLTIEILSRLPVKDLLECRCVVRSWLELTGTADFVKIHLKQSKEANSNTGHLLRSKQNNELYWLDLNTFEEVKLNLPIYPIKFKDSEYEVLGSCNGLLALSASNYLFAFWNPFTQSYIDFSMPEPGVEGVEGNSYIYGFGYDPQGDDYKLVRIFGLHIKDNVISVHLVDIYSLKNKSHRRICNFPHYCAPYKDGILVNNALHWVVHPKKESIASKSILAFDLVSEEYRQVPIPYEDFDYDRNLCLSGTLGGRLCVEYWTNSSECMEVWVMEKYGVKESWTKLFSLSDNDCFVPCLITLTYWKTPDDVLVIDDLKEEYIIYNLKTEMIFTKVKFPFNHRHDLTPKICVQSLVGFNDDGWKIIKKEGEGEEQKTEVQPSGTSG